MGFFSKLKKLFRKPFKFIKKWLIPKQKTQARGPIEVGQRYGSAQALGVLYGTETIPGVVVDQNVTTSQNGIKNDTLHMIVVFCAGPIQQIYEVYFDGVPSTVSKFAGRFTMDLRLGEPDQEAFEGAYGNLNRYEGATYPGIVAGYFTFKQDAEQSVWTADPEITIRALGRLCYDPRIDGYNTSTTYANPALCLLDLIKDPIWGPGKTNSEINIPYFIREANAADTFHTINTRSISCQIDETGSYVCTDGEWEPVTVPRFTLNIFLDSEKSHFDNMVAIANTFRGYWPSPDGRIAIAGEREGEPVFDLNESNLISATLSEADINDRYNRVIVQFTDTRLVRTEREVCYPQLGDSQYDVWLAEDNGIPSVVTLKVEGIANPHEALQLAEIAAKSSRQAKQVSCLGFPECQELDIGDIVSFSWADFGYASKEFRVTRIRYLDNGEVEMDLAQHEDGIYPWSEVSYDDITGGSYLGDPSIIDAVTGLSILPDTTGATSGRLTWNYIANAFVRLFKVSVDVYETSYSLTSDLVAGVLILPVFPSPKGEATGATVKIGAQTYTVASTQINQFTLQTPTTEPYTSGEVLITDFPSNVFRSETIGKSHDLPLLAPNNYRATVNAVSTIGAVSPNASVNFNLIVPVPPSSLNIIATNFELTVTPVLAGGAGLGTQFEVAINTTTDIRGRGTVIPIVGLTSGTTYTVYCRTINSLGVSAWMFVSATTTANATDIVGLIGEDIADQILPGVVAQVSENLETIVTDSLVGYSTTTEVNQLISDRIDDVNQVVGEDPRVNLVAIMQNALSNFQTGENLKTETKERTTVTEVLSAAIGANASEIEQTNQVIADLETATATSILALTSASGETNANLESLQQTVTTLSSATSTSLLSLQSLVDNNTAGLLITNQTIVDLESATSSSISGLTTQFNTVNENLDDAVVRLTEAESAIIVNSTAISTETSARSTQYNGLNSRLTTTENDLNTAESRITTNESSIVTTNQTLATESTTRATQVGQLQARVTVTEDGIDSIESELTAQINRVDEVVISSGNNASAISAVTGTVNNPITGLSATFTLATTAKSTADGATIAANSVTLAVNNPTTGLSATNTIAQTANSTANNALSSATSITNTVNHPTTGLAATATIASGAKTTADGAALAVTGLQTQVGTIDTELSSAQLILQSTVDELGVVWSRAFFGVSSVTGDIATTTGIVVDGATKTLEFRNDKLRLSSTDGTVRMYYSSLIDTWIYTGDMVAGTFKTALSGYRAEMSGVGDYPIWYGAGDKTWGNAAFLVDNAGNVKMANALMFNCNIQGRLVTDSGSGVRSELYDDGTYLFWIGTGTKNDANGTFWVKRNGTGFIKGEFFQGQIIETKMAAKEGGWPDSLTVNNHSSAGKPVKITASINLNYNASGNTQSTPAAFTITVKRGSTTLTSLQFSVGGFFDSESNQTIYSGGSIMVAVDTSTVEGLRNYTMELARTQGPAEASSASAAFAIETFENKLG